MTKLKNNKKNDYRLEIIEDEECIIFTTLGKTNVEVIVDKVLWDKYLQNFKWTATKDTYGRYLILSSIKNKSKSIYRLIVETEFDELWTFGRFVDHINHNSLDNRLCNLRTVSHKRNSSDVTSKKEHSHIYEMKDGGYQVKMNINDKVFHKYFKDINDAIEYRDNVLIPIKEKELIELEKKERKFDFERGLALMLHNNENDDVINILNKYHIN